MSIFGDWKSHQRRRRMDQLIELFGHYPSRDELAERREQYEEKKKLKRLQALARIMAEREVK